MAKLERQEVEERAKELKREYYREYYRKNKERRKQINKNTWIRKAEQELLEEKKGDK